MCFFVCVGSVLLIRRQAPGRRNVLSCSQLYTQRLALRKALLGPGQCLLERGDEGLGSRGPHVPGCELETLSCEQWEAKSEISPGLP